MTVGDHVAAVGANAGGALTEMAEAHNWLRHTELAVLRQEAMLGMAEGDHTAVVLVLVLMLVRQ